MFVKSSLEINHNRGKTHTFKTPYGGGGKKSLVVKRGCQATCKGFKKSCKVRKLFTKECWLNKCVNQWA